MQKINLKKMSFVFVIFGMLLFSNILFAETNYDIVNIDTTNYNYSPAPVEQGDNFELWVQLTNNSNVIAENIDYELDLEYPFSLVDYVSLDGTISSIAPYQTKILKFKLKTDFSTNSGTYKVKLKYKREGLDVFNIQEYNIDVVSRKAIVDIISSNVEKVSLGKESFINLNIKNLSNNDAKDIFVTVGNSEDLKAKVLNLSTKYIEKLNSNENINLEYSILVDKSSESKSYNLPVTIVYSDNFNEHTITRNLGVEIIDNPNILVNVLDVGNNNIVYSNNSKQTLDLEIYNTGNVDAESVYVEVVNTELLKNNIKYFVGTIEKDNYDNLEVNLDTKNIESGDYVLDIIVNYKDGNLIKQSISEKLNIKVVANNSANNSVSVLISSIFGILGFIIGLALFIVILKWLYRVLLKPAYSGLFKNCKLFCFKKRKK